MDKYMIQLSALNRELLNNKTSYIEQCENNYKMQMEKIVEYLKINPEIKFILMAGPSSTGKTTTAKLLEQKLQQSGFNAKPISLDDFFVERVDTPLWDNGKPNYETVDAIDWTLFSSCMHALQTEGKTIMPSYNFITGSKNFNHTLSLNKNDIIIIEGLHSLNPVIDNFIVSTKSLKVYLSPSIVYLKNDEEIIDDISLRFFRRLIRDCYTRGSTPEKTLEEWEGVRRGEKLYIDPYKHTANFSINTAHPYEISVYKSIIKKVGLDSNPTIKQMFSTFESVISLDKEVVPKHSLIQEFVH